ncbi:MAG: flagellin N-terminal helical domain-containing protein, partial [Planctomycetota bacterium]
MANWGAIYNTTLSALRVHSAAMARLQEQASSGARVIRPSDDPADAHKILKLRGQQQALGTYTANLEELVHSLNVGDTILQTISNRFGAAKASTLSGANGATGQTVRHVLAEEIDAILEEVLSLANTSSLGRYVLGGADVTTKPFEATRVNGKIQSVRYVGSQQDLPVPVAP